MADITSIIGVKMDLVPKRKKTGATDGYTYYSKVLDVIVDGNDEKIKALMPIYEGHIVPLDIGEEYQAYFTMTGNIYECGVKVSGRSKEGNIYVMTLLVTSKFNKVQRREFYRLPCDMPANVTPLLETEVVHYEHTRVLPDELSQLPKLCTALDVSGGGIRFYSSETFEKDTWVLVEADVPYNNDLYKLKALGKVIASYHMANKTNVFETRIQFRYMGKEAKETLIKFIFSEQRKIQKRQRNV